VDIDTLDASDMNRQIEQYVDQITYYPSKRLSNYAEIPDEWKTAVFLQLSNKVKYQILLGQPKEEVVKLLESLDPVDATDILQLFDKRHREELLGQLSENIKSNLSLLLSFDKDSAGGLMTLNYIQVNINDKMFEVAEKFRTHEKRTGKSAEILVLRDGTVMGYLPTYALGFATPNQLITDHIKPIKTIRYNTSGKDVLSMFRSYPHSKLVVLDDNSFVVGVIYSDDVLKVLREQEGMSLYNFAGINREEEVFDPASVKIRFRYKWLLINLATAFFASFTVGLFRDTLDKYVLLAVYMPIVAGMGGNSATQTLAVMVRGIALRQINLSNFVSPLLSELGSALVNGLMNGVLVFGIVVLLNGEYLIGTVLAVAMVINLLVAAFFGTITPLLMKHWGKDPASSATIFITTATDVLGFLAFLGLATLLLR
jgi:magnesium transporter